jgi:hypothetical protein
MNIQEEQKQIALTRFVAIIAGCEGAQEARAAALEEAMAYGITNTECIRDGIRQKALGIRPPKAYAKRGLRSRDISRKQESVFFHQTEHAGRADR